MFLKNTANQWIGFALISQADGGGLPGLTPLAWVSKDGGVAALGGGTVRDRGNGQYAYGPTQAESNCGELSVILTAPLAVPMEKTVYPFDLAVGLVGVFAYTIGVGVPFGPNNLIEVTPTDGLLWDNAGGGAAWLRLQNAGPAQTGTVNTVAQTFAGNKTFVGIVSSTVGFTLPHTVINETPGAFGFTHSEPGPSLSNFGLSLNSQPGFVNCVLVDLNGGATLPRFGLQIYPNPITFGVYGTMTDGSVVAGGIILSIGGGGGGGTSGTYTPIVTPGAGCAAVGASPCQWLKVGNTVTVSGRINVTAAAPGVVAQWLTQLPVPSVLTQPEQVAGTGLPDQSGAPLQGPVSIQGDVASGQALMGTVQPGFAIATDYYWHFTYQVL